MSEAANAIADLPPLKWRTLPVVPCETADVDLEHQLAARHYPYLDVEGHDPVGRKSMKLPVRLHFNNTISPNLFPKTFNNWLEALLDGQGGDLVHPLLGKRFVYVEKGTVKCGAQNRAGVVVEVTFVESRKSTTEDAKLSLNYDVQYFAAQADAQCAAAGITYPDGHSETSLLGMIKSIQGQIFSAWLKVAGLASLASVGLDVVDRLYMMADAQNTHMLWPLKSNLNRVSQWLLDVKEIVKAANRTVLRVALEREMSLVEFADAVGNAIADVADLNPGMLRHPTVPAGTILSYYK